MCELFRLSPCASGKLAYLIWMTTLRYLAHAGLVAIAVSAGLGTAGAESRIFDTKAVRVQTDIVTDELEHPWGLDFLPDGDVIVTERAGRIRVLSQGRLSKPVAGVPKVAEVGQGGLLDVAASPDFARSNLIFFSFSEPGRGGAGTAIARAKLVRDGSTPRLEDVQIIFSMANKTRAGQHFGSLGPMARSSSRSATAERARAPKTRETMPAQSCASTGMARSRPTTPRRTARGICPRFGQRVIATRRAPPSILFPKLCSLRSMAHGAATS